MIQNQSNKVRLDFSDHIIHIFEVVTIIEVILLPSSPEMSYINNLSARDLSPKIMGPIDALLAIACLRGTDTVSAREKG